jgi:hypothetical protein
MRPGRAISCLVPALALALVIACSGGSSDGDDGGDGDEPVATSTSAATGATSTGATAPAGAGGDGAAASGDGEDFDVCTLLTHEEVESVIAQTAGPPAFSPMDLIPGVGGGDCRFEADGITPIVSVTVLIWEDEDDAESSFDLLDHYPAVDGIGDGAYNTQPAGDLSFRSGRYEVSVDLYFVSEDDAADLEMAQQLAELVLPRLP